MLLPLWLPVLPFVPTSVNNTEAVVNPPVGSKLWFCSVCLPGSELGEWK